MELIETYRRSLAEFTDRVAQVRPDQWSAPTPCSGWDVRTLVNHVVNEDRWTVPMFEGATIDEVGDRFGGDLLGADAAGAAREAALQAELAVTEPGAVDRIVHLSFGDMPAREYLRQLTGEHLVHGWDLAKAIGAEPRLDARAVEDFASWFATREKQYHEWGAIADEVPVSPQANTQDRLIAAFGRDSDWQPD